MILLLDSFVSQDFWRLVYPSNRAPGIAPVLQPIPEAAYKAEDILRLAPSWLTEDYLNRGSSRIDALVFRQEDRRKSNNHIARSWSGKLPPGSFYDLGHGVLVASPGFIFLRMASQLSFSELIAYGDELCGLYSFDSSSPRGIRQRTEPLASVKKLEEYLEGAKGGGASKLAKRCSTWLIGRVLQWKQWMRCSYVCRTSTEDTV